MKHISDLFSRYKTQIKPPQAIVVKEFVSICKDVAGFSIKPEQCTYVVATRTIYLNTPSIIKSELLQKKSILLKEMSNRLGDSSAKQII